MTQENAEDLMRAILEDGDFTAEALKLGENAPTDATGVVRVRPAEGDGRIDFDELDAFLVENSRDRLLLEVVSTKCVDVWLLGED